MTLRINGQIAPSVLGAKQAQKAKSGSFKLEIEKSDTGTDKAQKVGASTSLLGLDGLLAIQSGDHNENDDKKRRQMKRSRFRLDQLDKLKLGLLSEDNELNALKALENDLNNEREPLDDPDLEALIMAIELRSRVELAKRGLV